jgi:hypothetical protein
MKSYGNDDTGCGKPPELSGNPTSRDIWERAGEIDEKVRILHVSMRYINGYLTSRKILRHGTSGDNECTLDTR